jgi:sugar lactone lactonase YvrE
MNKEPCMPPLDLADDHRLALGEGALWDGPAGRVYWIGIEDCEVRWLTPKDGARGAVRLDTMPGAIAPYRGEEVLLAVADGFAVLDTATGALTLVAEVETDRPDRRMNDGKCDPYGRMVAGTMQVEEPRRPGPLHRLDRESGRAVPILDGLLIPNGLDWPEPDLLWHIDTPKRRIDLFAYPEHGPLGAPLRSIDVSGFAGDPDGMTLDRDGNLWVAFWGGSAVRCLSPRGRLLETVEVPTVNVTNCAFGGPALDTLYITTAGGGLYSCPGLTTGRPATAWAGLGPA